MRIIRMVAAVSLVVATTGVAAVPAVAAAPANDTYSGREVLLDPLPILVMADTAEATADADDAELNMQCGAPATDASVWYQYTPTVEGELAISTLASDYSVGAIVATGGPGTWLVENCGAQRVRFLATPGTTYTILVFDDQEDGGGNGGYLELTLEQAPAPPSIDVTVNPRATFDARTGAATLTGTYACAASEGGTIEYTFLDVSVTQRAGRVNIQGNGFIESLLCDGTGHDWIVTTEWTNGLFKGGKAKAQIYAEACSEGSCRGFEETQAIKLSATKK